MDRQKFYILMTARNSLAFCLVVMGVFFLLTGDRAAGQGEKPLELPPRTMPQKPFSPGQLFDLPAATIQRQALTKQKFLIQKQ